VSAVDVRLLVSRPRRWHLDLVGALGDAGARVEVDVVDRGGSWDPDVEALFRRERRLHRLGPGTLEPLDAALLPRTSAGPGGLRIDLTGGPGADDDWRLTFDDAPGEGALAHALLAGRFPVVRVVDATGHVLAEGRPGSELPGVLVAAAGDVLAGAGRIVVAAASGHCLRLPDDPTAQSDGPGTVRSPASRSRRTLAQAAVRRTYRTLYRTPHWRVGWRFCDGPGVVATGHLPEGWHDLPDDGRHFYADPFPVTHDGRTHLFVEDFEHDRGRGVISVVEFDDRGPVGTPHPVLEHRVHLSYPMVVEDGGELWMIPETSAAGTVELYRAVDYPDRWELESVLLRDVDANDATPFRHGGRWWLAATVRRRGSCSDTLHLWYADELTGPWKPHDRNPVLVDIASARPAGRPHVDGGRLLRPVQDGRRGYGAALAVVEVVELDPSTYSQRVVARLAPGAAWPGSRLHTVNRAGRLEVVDGSARSLRLRPGGRR
jgi:hypothetical protein